MHPAPPSLAHTHANIKHVQSERIGDGSGSLWEGAFENWIWCLYISPFRHTFKLVAACTSAERSSNNCTTMR